MPKVPVYPWFDQVPKNLKTRNQLGELGLKPGGPVVARVEWGRGRKAKVAYLYDVGRAVAKRALSAPASATIQSQKLARRTCPVCRRVFEHILRDATCKECYDYIPGVGGRREGRFDIRKTNPDIYRVWLPEGKPIGPYAAPVEENQRWYDWIPYPKVEFRLMLSDRDFGPLLPNHTHTWFYGRPIGDLLAEWSIAEFAALAQHWPILREWAIDASLPGDCYLAQALAGLEREDAAELKFLWYERRTLYHRDMRQYTH